VRTLIGHERVVVMKTNFNQTGSWRVFLKGAAVICLSGLPVMFISTIPAPAGELVVVKLPASVTSAEIQRALDALPENGGEVVLPPAGLRFASQSF
jgi:hypothetical protein